MVAARLDARPHALLVGRSWGAAVLLRMLTKLAKAAGAEGKQKTPADAPTKNSVLPSGVVSGPPSLDAVKCLVLIAPAAPTALLDELPSRIKALPVLLVWAKDDPIVPYSGSEKVLEAFTGIKRTLLLESAVPQDATPSERWMGHAPELQRKDEFAQAILSLMQELDSGVR